MVTEIATFAGGCFWCTEAAFKEISGIIKVQSGYTGGKTKNPTYEEVCSGKTGHYEAIRLSFDPQKISYEKILLIFWQNIDPTDADGQFADRGTEYGTVIFYHTDDQKRLAELSKKKIEKQLQQTVVTKILPAQKFYPAEEHHQNFAGKCPIRYTAYKYGSGRVKGLKELWATGPAGN